jgi:cytidylate kinase
MAPADAPHPPVVTIAALYGAGGSVIGPRVAELLSVPLIDREIPDAAARKAGVSIEALADVEEEPRRGVGRLVASLGRATTMSGSAGGREDLDLDERRLRAYLEEAMARAAVLGCVTVGRGGMVVLRSAPSALHVHLGGPRGARRAQRMRLEGIDRQTAERRQKDEDRMRIGYVRRAYGADGEDPRHYHLMLDSTALDLGTCAELIVQAARARTRNPRPSPPT